MSPVGRSPDVEIRTGNLQRGYRTWATIIWRPFRLWVLGRWLVGGPRSKSWPRDAQGKPL